MLKELQHASRQRRDADTGYAMRNNVLLPPDLEARLTREELAKEEAEAAAQASERAAKEGLPKNEDPPDYGLPSSTKRKKVNPFQGLTPDAFPPPPEGSVQVVDFSGLVATGKTMAAKYTDKMDTDRLEAMGEHLREHGPHRLLAPLRSNWREGLVRLGVDMPNFLPVLEVLSAEFALAEVLGVVPTLPPLLLTGAPGVGKSRFAEALAQLLGTPYYRVQMESVSGGSTLAGMAANWGNTKPGAVFDALVMGTHANPVFLLDELDKVPHPREYTHPLAALYSLWEPASARAFKDNSLPMFKFDARHVFWLATANYPDLVPPPVRSRMLELPVAPLTRVQAVRVVLKLYGELETLLESKAQLEPLAEALAEKLATRSPRNMKRLLRTAVGRALHQNRRGLTAEDLAVAEGVVSMKDKATEPEHPLGDPGGSERSGA